MTSKKPIADWWFEDGNRPITFIRIEEFIELLVMCQKCLSVLATHELLIPTNISLSDTWIYYNEKGECADSFKYGVTTIESGGEEKEALKDLVLPHVLSKQLDKGFVFPAHFEVIGNGVILDEFGGKVVAPHVTNVEARFISFPIVDVTTSNYAWLPYSLNGDAQERVYKHNSPRLEKALVDIERVLGITGTTDKASDYCEIHGYRLDNFRDFNGAPLAVGEYGGIIES